MHQRPSGNILVCSVQNNGDFADFSNSVVDILGERIFFSRSVSPPFAICSS